MGTFTVIQKAAALKISDLSSDQLYDLLSKYVMKEDDLKQYGYPFMDPSEPGKALFANKDILSKSLKVDDFKSLTRVCSRCKSTYKVNDEGIPLKKEHCIYHPGRIWTERFNRSIERIFSCCKGDHLAGGCCTGMLTINMNFFHLKSRPNTYCLSRIHDRGFSCTRGNRSS